MGYVEDYRKGFGVPVEALEQRVDETAHGDFVRRLLQHAVDGTLEHEPFQEEAKAIVAREGYQEFVS